MLVMFKLRWRFKWSQAILKWDTKLHTSLCSYGTAEVKADVADKV